MAFQSNVLCDNAKFGSTWERTGFEAYFHNMVEELERRNNFYFPQLGINMRNSSDIAELSNNLETEQLTNRLHNRISNIIPKLKSHKDVKDKNPKAFAVFQEDINRVIDLADIIKDATENGEIQVILIDDSGLVQADDIKTALIESKIAESQQILVHTLESNSSREDIKKFLTEGKGFLVCQATLFTGMEAESIVYFMTDRTGCSVRSHLSRASSKLNIVYCYIPMESKHPQIPEFELKGATTIKKFIVKKSSPSHRSHFTIRSHYSEEVRSSEDRNSQTSHQIIHEWEVGCNEFRRLQNSVTDFT